MARSARRRRCGTSIRALSSSAAGCTRSPTSSTRSRNAQPRAKTLVHEMMEAPSASAARRARETFRSGFEAKYPKAMSKLDRDWKQLTAFYAFPAEHWRFLRTTNPIESSFATVKLRTRVTKGRWVEGRRVGDGLQAAQDRRGTLA